MWVENNQTKRDPFLLDNNLRKTNQYSPHHSHDCSECHFTRKRWTLKQKLKLLFRLLNKGDGIFVLAVFFLLKSLDFLIGSFCNKFISRLLISWAQFRKIYFTFDIFLQRCERLKFASLDNLGQLRCDILHAINAWAAV